MAEVHSSRTANILLPQRRVLCCALLDGPGQLDQRDRGKQTVACFIYFHIYFSCFYFLLFQKCLGGILIVRWVLSKYKIDTEIKEKEMWMEKGDEFKGQLGCCVVYSRDH